MRAVLGIDAAWTATQPSGVAVVVEQDGVWRLAIAASSYAGFMAPLEAAKVRPAGGLPDAHALIEACRNIAGAPPDLVAIDMPLSRVSITARRAADNEVSAAYGARHCSTHTPSATRPGRISDDLSLGFGAAGYALQTTGRPQRGLIEVYPHPALVELARAERRLPYKVAKARSYWPDLPPLARRERLLEIWASIVEMLDDQIAGVREAVPMPLSTAPGVALKAFEDMLDAIVCAWVGTRVLAGEAVPFGDIDAAIWVPASISISGARSAVSQVDQRGST